MTAIEKLKEKCDNYLDTRVYNYIKAKKRQKAILRDRKKVQIFKSDVNFLNSVESCFYKNTFLGIDVKKSFINLHFIKMLKHYNYLNFYHENIKKLNYNKRLLCYLEAILEPKGFFLKKFN